MNVYKFSYTLETNQRPNALTQEKKRQGALLKVEFAEDLTGYADCHPILEFGDKEIKDQLQSLKNKPEPLIEQSLLLAKLDAQARKDKHDLLSGAFLLSNHYLSLDYCEEKIANAAADGFEIVKIKMGHDIENETEKLVSLQSKFSRLRWRIDFNNKLNFKDFCAWGEKNFELLEKVDFIEDPFPYSKDWSEAKYRLPVKFAIDLAAEDLDCQHADVIVLKPARFNIIERLKKLNLNKHQFVITHSMDHFIGQAHAIAMTIKAKFFLKDKLISCGLNNRDLFVGETLGLQSRGPHIISEDGAGIGFDDYLKACDWELCHED